MDPIPPSGSPLDSESSFENTVNQTYQSNQMPVHHLNSDDREYCLGLVGNVVGDDFG